MSSDSFRFNVIRSIEFPSIFIARVDEYTIIFLSFSISRLFSFQQFLRNVLRRITISMTFLLNSFLLPPFVCYLLRTICIIFLISENTWYTHLHAIEHSLPRYLTFARVAYIIAVVFANRCNRAVKLWYIRAELETSRGENPQLISAPNPDIFHRPLQGGHHFDRVM